MLVAEIHGKYRLEARNSEDYLTSAVFGHLRYIKPGPFWDTLFNFSVSQPIGTKSITASEQILVETCNSLSSFANLKINFWPEHKEGIPDLVLHFSGNHPRSVIILIEAKLNATKSGTGENDQLARYLRILNSIDGLRPPVPPDALALIIYLTATDSRGEIIESLQQYGDTDEARKRLFHMQWQDVIRAIDRTTDFRELDSLILNDVRKFLCARELAYFSGMESATAIPAVLEADGDFIKVDRKFDFDLIPNGLSIIDERWMRGN